MTNPQSFLICLYGDHRLLLYELVGKFTVHFGHAQVKVSLVFDILSFAVEHHLVLELFEDSERLSDVHIHFSMSCINFDALADVFI
jgi:hypothetical protein